MNLLDQLSKDFPDSSKSALRSWIKWGRVAVNGLVTRRSNAVIPPGGKVELLQKRQTAGPLVILFEDEHLVVIEKPHGILSVETHYDTSSHAHAELKKHHNGRVFPVHRLDRETSGIMLFTYTEEAREHLKEQFFNKSVAREYRTWVEGHLEEDSGTWKSHLVEDANYKVHSAKQGKLAITHFKVLKRSRTQTLLSIKLETGRKNQIRVHASEAGHPIVGDTKYGALTNSYGRLALHAHSLSFQHPKTKETLHFASKKTV